MHKEERQRGQPGSGADGPNDIAFVGFPLSSSCSFPFD